MTDTAAAELMFRPATELAGLVRSGELSAREIVETSLSRIDALEPDLQRVHRRLPRGRAGGGRRDRARRRPPARRGADRDQEQPAGRREALDLLVVVLRRLPRADGRGAGHAPARCRRDHRRDDEPPRAGHRQHDGAAALRRVAQPVGSAADDRRLLRRLRGRRRRRHGADRPRQRRRRLDADPGGLLRARRPEGPARSRDARAVRRLLVPRHRRRAEPDRPRLRRRPRRAGRARTSATSRGPPGPRRRSRSRRPRSRAA